MDTPMTRVWMLGFGVMALAAGAVAAGAAIGGLVGFCVGAVLAGGLAVGGVQAAALMVLHASDDRQTAAAARGRGGG